MFRAVTLMEGHNFRVFVWNMWITEEEGKQEKIV
jgi:hypothetical protein